MSLHLKDRKKKTQNESNGKADVESTFYLRHKDVGITSVIAEAKKQGKR